MANLDEARDQLHQRLGVGARYDDPTAPVQALQWARLGTAYFARKLNAIADQELLRQDQHGLRLRQIICRIGYQARGFAETIEQVRLQALHSPAHSPLLGGHLALTSNPLSKLEEMVALGVSLPAAAIRHLFKHSHVHLNVEWRDLTAAGWESVVDFADHSLTIRLIVWQRAQALWISAYDLGKGGSFDDFPAELLDALLKNAATGWQHSSGFMLRPTDRDYALIFGEQAEPPVISGSSADLAQWLSGRGANSLTTTQASLPFIPFADLTGDGAASHRSDHVKH